MKSAKFLLIVLLNIFSIYSFAAPDKSKALYAIKFQSVVNGKASPDGPKTRLVCSPVASKSWIAGDSVKILPTIAVETSYVDYALRKTFQVAKFNTGSLIHTSSDFSTSPVLSETTDHALILGYSCKKVKTSLRSNSIDIWYTTELGVKGTPSMGYGIPEGLVLKIVRNGNYELVATEIKPLKQTDLSTILPDQMGEELDLPLYRHRITQNIITTLPIFTNEQISFGNTIVNPADSSTQKTFKYASGTEIGRAHV